MWSGEIVNESNVLTADERERGEFRLYKKKFVVERLIIKRTSDIYYLNAQQQPKLEKSQHNL